MLGKNKQGEGVLLRIGSALDAFHCHEQYTAKNEAGEEEALWIKVPLPAGKFSAYFIKQTKEENARVFEVEDNDVVAIMTYLIEQQNS